LGINGYYLGAMLSGVHQITRAAGVPLLVIHSISIWSGSTAMQPSPADLT
jgi:hypothetical protein